MEQHITTLHSFIRDDTTADHQTAQSQVHQKSFASGFVTGYNDSQKIDQQVHLPFTRCRALGIIALWAATGGFKCHCSNSLMPSLARKTRWSTAAVFLHAHTNTILWRSMKKSPLFAITSQTNMARRRARYCLWQCLTLEEQLICVWLLKKGKAHHTSVSRFDELLHNIKLFT